MTLIIEHTHETGTLLHGTSKGDGSNLALKAAGGWRWSRNLGCWYIQGSRDKDAKDHYVSRAVRELEAAGFTVEVDIDNTARDYAQVVADQNARLEDRAEALAAKAQRKDAAAEAAEQVRLDALRQVPEGGEPIKIGHHSEGRHRRSIDRAWNTLGKSVEADREAARAHEKAEASRVNTELKDSPRAVASRIPRLEVEERQWQKSVDAYRARGEVSARHEEGLRRVQEKLEHWRGVHAQNIADGLFTEYSKDTVKVGDWVYVGGGWVQVVRANPKTVTVDVSAIFGCQHSLKYDWHKVRAHLTPEQKAAAE